MAPALRSEARTETADLITRLQAGDQSAFAEIYDNYSRLIHVLIFRMVRDAALAEDLVQEVFLKLWRSAATLDRSVKSLGPWLIAVARHRALDHIKSLENRNAKASGSLDTEMLGKVAWTPEFDFVFEERVRALRRGLERLDDRERKVLELIYFGGLTHSEMAVISRQPLGTVKSRVRLALRKLREHLEGQDQELLATTTLCQAGYVAQG